MRKEFRNSIMMLTVITFFSCLILFIVSILGNQASKIKQKENKKHDRKIKKYKTNWEKLQERLPDDKNEFEIIEDEKEMPNSTEDDFGTTFNLDTEHSDDIPDFTPKKNAYQKGKEKFKNALNKFFSNVSSGWGKILKN